MAMMDSLTGWIETLVTFPVFVPLVTVIAYLDAVIPAIPAEPVVSLGASWSGSTGSPNVWHIAIAAFIGASLGDNTCYIVGRRFQRQISRIRPNSRIGKALTWIHGMLKVYGGATIIIARFVPYARWTLTIVLGSIRYRWITFFIYDTIGVCVWVASVTVVSYLGGYLLQGSPILGVVVGIAAGMAVGVGIQKAQNAFLRWREEKRGISAA